MAALGKLGQVVCDAPYGSHRATMTNCSIAAYHLPAKGFHATNLRGMIGFNSPRSIALEPGTLTGVAADEGNPERQGENRPGTKINQGLCVFE